MTRPAVALLFLLAGCQAGLSRPAPIGAGAGPLASWQRVASQEDADHLGDVDAAWARGLASARADGFGRRIVSEGALLDPAAALPRPAPPPGAFLCRVVRLGRTAPDEPAFAGFRPFYCFVGVGGPEGDRLSITKSEGSQRPAGYLWDDLSDRSRMIFLGALAPGRGPVIGYGDDRTRDVAGIFERIGPLRYRLVIPWPRNGAAIEIFELVPAPVQSDE